MPTVNVNDIEMYYEITGKGDPLVFIHGLGSSSQDWEYQTSEFSKKYRVITMDLRGHGKSDKPAGPYSISMFADDVAELLKTIGISPVHVVGLSMGSATGFHIAIDYPDLVKTLTVSNMTASLPVKTFAEKKMFYTRLIIIKFMGMKKMGQMLAPRLFTKPEQQHLRDTLVERCEKNDKKAYLEAMKALKNWSVLERVHTITCPTLVIHAENDYSTLDTKKEYTKLIPNAELKVIEEAGHAANMEKPEAYNLILDDFLSRH